MTSERNASCCSAEGAVITDEQREQFGSPLYDAEDRDQLPDAAVLASLGCGNPIAIAELHEGETVLDLGSGGGIDVLLSAKRVGPTGLAYGLDMTDEMLDLARRNQAEAGVSNVQWLRGHIEEIPLPAATVDVIISNCVINLSGDKPRVLREAARVLKPGGRFAVSDVVADPDMDQATREDMAAYTGCIAGALTRDEFTGAPRSRSPNASRPSKLTHEPKPTSPAGPATGSRSSSLSRPAEWSGSRGPAATQTGASTRASANTPSMRTPTPADKDSAASCSGPSAPSLNATASTSSPAVSSPTTTPAVPPTRPPAFTKSASSAATDASTANGKTACSSNGSSATLQAAERSLLLAREPGHLEPPCGWLLSFPFDEGEHASSRQHGAARTATRRKRPGCLMDRPERTTRRGTSTRIWPITVLPV